MVRANRPSQANGHQVSLVFGLTQVHDARGEEISLGRAGHQPGGTQNRHGYRN
jgi:hypothetical protein